MSTYPGIVVKDYPEDINNLILDKQNELKKKKKTTVNKSQTILALLREAYLAKK